MDQITKKTPTNIHYPERAVFMKQVITQNFWNFDLGTQDGNNAPIWIYVVFQQSDRQHDQNLNSDTLFIMPVTSAQGIIGSEEYRYSALLLNYNADDYSQAYGQITELCKPLTKNNILQLYISGDDFRSSNDGDNIGYNNRAFDI